MSNELQADPQIPPLQVHKHGRNFNSAIEIRDQLCKYFNNEGRVPDKMKGFLTATEPT